MRDCRRLERFAGVGPLADLVDARRPVRGRGGGPRRGRGAPRRRAFAARYGALTDRPSVVGLTGEVARTLVARSFRGRLDATVLLSSQGRLRAQGLLSLDPPGDLSGLLRPDPALVAWLLGLPEEVPVASADFPARPLTTVHTLSDVVLPAAARTRIDDLAARITQRDTVVDDWGFGAHHDNASGLIALFHGPPGTGKTMTAAALAASAGRAAYIVDISALVSKYIGDTEKSLARIFDRAAREQSILVFDEADAVFGTRTDVSGAAHDRYANQEVSYLLSRIEQHPGMVVLTTNLLGNIDAAFRRRIHVVVVPNRGPANASGSGRSGARVAADGRCDRPARPRAPLPADGCADPRRDARCRLPRRVERPVDRHDRAPARRHPSPVREGGADGATVSTPVTTRAGPGPGPDAERAGAGSTRSPRDAVAPRSPVGEGPPVLGSVPRPVGDAAVVALDPATTAGGLSAVQAEWGVDGGAVVLSGRGPFTDGARRFRFDGSLDGSVEMRAPRRPARPAPRRGDLAGRGLGARAAPGGPGRDAPRHDARRRPATHPGGRPAGRRPRASTNRPGSGAQATIHLPGGDATPPGLPLTPRVAEVYRDCSASTSAASCSPGLPRRRRARLRHRRRPLPRSASTASTAPRCSPCSTPRSGPRWAASSAPSPGSLHCSCHPPRPPLRRHPWLDTTVVPATVPEPAVLAEHGRRRAAARTGEHCGPARLRGAGHRGGGRGGREQ